MALKLLGIDPNSDGDNCPTVWFDEASRDYVVQGWKITDLDVLAEVGNIPGRETVLRIPARMAMFFTETP